MVRPSRRPSRYPSGHHRQVRSSGRVLQPSDRRPAEEDAQLIGQFEEAWKLLFVLHRRRSCRGAHAAGRSTAPEAQPCAGNRARTDSLLVETITRAEARYQRGAAPEGGLPRNSFGRLSSAARSILVRRYFSNHIAFPVRMLQGRRSPPSDYEAVSQAQAQAAYWTRPRS